MKRLETLFDRFYSDTFGMVRDTFSDFRKHAWSGDPHAHSAGDGSEDGALVEVERRVAENIAKLRGEMMSEVGDLAQKLGATSTQIDSLAERVGDVVDKAILGSREAEDEALKTTIREQLLERIEKATSAGSGSISAARLVDDLTPEFSLSDVLEQIQEMKQTDLVSFEGDQIIPSTKITLPLRRRRLRRTRIPPVPAPSDESEEIN